MPGMLRLIEENRSQIEKLCRRFGIRRLELFGSAASGTFNPEASDVDFFYEFDQNPTGLADRFFGLQEVLQKLLGKKVDLNSAKDATNPYFLQVANRNRVTLYAAA